jgi:hypothetical protein
MNMRALLCILAVAGSGLTSCQTVTDPNTGRTVMSTPSIGQLLGLQPGGTQQAAATTGSAGPTEHYRQQLPGKTTDLALTPIGNGTWLVDVSMGQPDCVGEAKGSARESSRGVLTMERDAQGNECRIDIRRGPGTASIGEMGCMMDHGGACEFVADMQRIN